VIDEQNVELKTLDDWNSRDGIRCMLVRGDDEHCHSIHKLKLKQEAGVQLELNRKVAYT
jgi:hypothetical protein